MVHISNIFRNGKTVSCDYMPEESQKLGHIVMNTETLEIVEVKYSEYEFGKQTYVSHVRSKLEELLSTGGTLPKEAVSIWY